MKEFLARARSSSEAELGSLAVELSAWVLDQARSVRSFGEDGERKRLTKLLGSPSSQRLGLALTDRAHRSESAARTVAGVREVLARLGEAPDLGPVDRVQLAALGALGGIIPPVTTLALEARLKSESGAFVLDADALGEGLASLRKKDRRINLNQLGEEVLGEKDAARYIETTIALLASADADAVSVKLSSLYSQARVLAFDAVVRIGTEKVAPIFAAADRSEKLVYFDMEAYRDLELSLEIFLRSARDPRFLKVRAGIALQAYLPDTLELLARVAEGAKYRVQSGGRRLRVRLVKGANLASETVQASLSRLEVPIFPSKHEVDAHMKRVLRFALRPEHATSLEVGFGSHNIFDQAYAVLLADQRGVRSMLELEMLYGMAESVGTIWSREDRPVLVYAPAVSPASFPAAVAYLVRRLDENTSPENFLASSLAMEVGDASFEREAARFLSALDESYRKPVATRRTQDRRRSPASKSAEVEETSTSRVEVSLGPFENASDTDWTRSWNREALSSAFLEAQTKAFIVAPRIAGDVCLGPRSFGFDPSRPGAPSYELCEATAADIERALDEASRSSLSWSRVPLSERALILERCALELETDRLRLIALMVKDSGKRVEEADIEVSEAIDFARYYARSLFELGQRYEVRGRGVTVVTPPWNFPLAIPLGGCLAALAAGNSVILKPAPETPLVAQAGAEALYRAGVPPEVLTFLPCDDSVASPLVTDQRVRQVVLTGATSTAQLFLRMRPDLRLLAETGGKNAAYVSALSDREAAIHSIVQSAFGHAGQKCSALSLLVLEEEVYRDSHFRSALVDAAGSLPVGSAWDLESFVTPLIHPPSGPLRTVLERGDGRARWALRPRISPENPALVSPGILWGVPERGFAHTTEFFGPVLSVLRARDLEHGLSLMNATPYGLTAGFFGLSESEQVRFVSEMDAGNLYVNRGTTGAVVGRQPFGGRKASSFGPGAKAGGPGYVGELAWLTRKSPGVPVLADLSSDFGAGEPAEIPGTATVGEANWLRYEPTSTVLILGVGADDRDADATLVAAHRVGAKVTVYPGDGVPRSSWPDEVEHAHPVSVAFRAKTLKALLEKAGTRRIRLLGAAPPELRAITAELGLTVQGDPVSSDPELESRHYLIEQSISIAYHRYGNLSLKALHPLLRSR